MSDRSRELREGLRRLAEADAGEVLEQARVEARRRAVTLLADELTDELVRAAVSVRQADQQRPSAPESDSGGELWWAYCVLSAEAAPGLAAQLEGLEPGTAVEAVIQGDLAALASPVPRSEYGDEQLREHLEDISWLERTARGHEAVLEGALAEDSVVPLRLCTLYRDRDGVRRMLAEQHAALSRNLAAVTGCVEWGIKVFLDQARARLVIQEEGTVATAQAQGTGAGYLAERRQEREQAGQIDALCTRCAEEIEQALRPLTRAGRGNPVQSPEAHGRPAEMVVNAAYLVERERGAELESTVAELRARWDSQGLAVELTGPWPPYNFVADSAGVVA